MKIHGEHALRFSFYTFAHLMSILPTPLPEGGWYNDICIFGPIYGFIQNNYILYENTWENRH